MITAGVTDERDANPVTGDLDPLTDDGEAENVAAEIIETGEMTPSLENAVIGKEGPILGRSAVAKMAAQVPLRL